MRIFPAAITGLVLLLIALGCTVRVVVTATPEAAQAPTQPPANAPTVPPAILPAKFPIMEGWYLWADDGQFLGVITCNRHAADGVFNRYGTHGSRYSAESVWNRYGTYGGVLSRYSPFSRSGSPPKITRGKQYVYFTASSSPSPRLTPTDLILSCFADDTSTAAYWLDLIP